jgi:hypothetical protein
MAYTLKDNDDDGGGGDIIRMHLREVGWKCVDWIIWFRIRTGGRIL